MLTFDTPVAPLLGAIDTPAVLAGANQGLPTFTNTARRRTISANPGPLSTRPTGADLV